MKSIQIPKRPKKVTSLLKKKWKRKRSRRINCKPNVSITVPVRLHIRFFCFLQFRLFWYHFPIFFILCFPLLVTVVTKKKKKKSTATEVDSDSEEDEESDESSEKELKKKSKSKKNTQVAQGKYYCTCTSSFSVFLFFAFTFILISLSHFLYIMFSVSCLRK